MQDVVGNPRLDLFTLFVQFLGPSFSRCQIEYFSFFLVMYLRQLEFQCCQNHAIVAVCVRPWGCSGGCLVDTGFETCWCEYEVNLDVYF